MFCSFRLIFCPLNPIRRSAFFQIRIQEAKILRIQRIRILSTDFFIFPLINLLRHFLSKFRNFIKSFIKIRCFTCLLKNLLHRCLFTFFVCDLKYVNKHIKWLSQIFDLKKFIYKYVCFIKLICSFFEWRGAQNR